MAMATRIQVLDGVEVFTDNGFKLCLQWCRYLYGSGNPDDFGYRFIWRAPPAPGRLVGRLLAHRGQARIKSFAIMNELQHLAIAAGWGLHVGS